MLGLRRHKNVQIDLWQGDISTFDVDHMFLFQNKADISQICLQADSSKARHISLQIYPPSSDAIATDQINPIFEQLKSFLDQTSLSKLKRLTFVAHNSQIYDVLQQALFSRFEDELDEEGY